MNAGPLAERAVTVVHVLLLELHRPAHRREDVEGRGGVLSVAWAPFETTVIPFPMKQGVFGIARTTGIPAPTASSMAAVETPAAIETRAACGRARPSP